MSITDEQRELAGHLDDVRRSVESLGRQLREVAQTAAARRAIRLRIERQAGVLDGVARLLAQIADDVEAEGTEGGERR